MAPMETAHLSSAKELMEGFQLESARANKFQTASMNDPPSLALQFPLAWESDDIFDVFEVQLTLDLKMLKKAVALYRSLPYKTSQSYECLVNLSCCLLALNDPRTAIPLLEKAVATSPTRAPAHLNLVAALRRIRNRSGALIAGKQALRLSTDFTAEEHRMILKSNRELTADLAPKTPRGDFTDHSKKEAADLKPKTPLGQKPVGTPRRHTVVKCETQKLSIQDIRKDLLSLKSDDVIKAGNNPPFGRHHVYLGEQQDQKAQWQAKWQPLKPEELELLRAIFAEPTRNEGSSSTMPTADDDMFVDRGFDSDSDDEFEARCLRLTRSNAKRAYEAIKLLPFMQLLPRKRATALLQTAELVEYPAEFVIFKQGDIATDLFVVISGTVTIEVLYPDLGANPVAVTTMYDGQVFGDAKVATWQAASAGPPLRKATSTTQEQTCLLRINPENYRKAMGALADGDDETEVRQKGSTTSSSGEETQVHTDLQRKVQALLRSPCFASAQSSSLLLLASNLQEITLRHGDLFIKKGQALNACYIVAEGYLRLSVAPDDRHVDEQIESPPMDAAPTTNEVATIQFAQDELDQPFSSSRQISKVKVKTLRSEVFQMTRRSLQETLVLPSLGKEEPTTGYVNGRPLTARQPGTPRRGTRWEATLRKERVAPYSGEGAESLLDFGCLHPGDACGLGALTDTKEECPYASGVDIRVESSQVRLLVLTQRSLLYVAEPVARTCMNMLQSLEDKVNVSEEQVTAAKHQRDKWNVRRKTVLHNTVMRDA